VEQTDAELVEAACRGDLAAFRRLYERHYRMAVGIAYSRLLDRHLAEDAAQEAFARGCRALATLRDASRFPHWLGVICRRTANELARTRRRHEPIRDIVESKSSSNAVATASAVREAIELLDAASRDIVMLHYFSRLSYMEIAEALAISREAVQGQKEAGRST
jgi:RNA polymerase sigma-70 factor (ECF subfamily)